MKGYRGSTYYGHPYLDDHGVSLDPYGVPMLIDDAPRRDEDLTQHDPPWTKRSHPYCYDPFTIWGEARPHKECNGTIYTDRLDQQDSTKYAQLAKKHYRNGDNGERSFGPFDSYNCKGHLIEAFLRDWLADPQLKLLRVVEYCHPYSGYPTWRLDYVSSKEAR